MSGKPGKRGGIPPLTPAGGGKIPPPETPRSTDDRHPAFRFKHADENKYCLRDWKAPELDDLVRAFKKIEGYTWGQIKGHGGKLGNKVGTGFGVIDKNLPTLPDGVPPDAVISEMRVDGTKRIFGYRVDEFYYLIWFDRNHEVCKM